MSGWRFGAAVDAFAAERGEVMAAWDELRARVRDEGEAVALSPAFRETLDRHGALMKQAASFRARPRVFERLLSERAGIGDGELQELREVHARAGSYLRSAAARAAHARQGTGTESEQARQNTETESEHARRDAEPAPEPARQTASAAETARPDPPAAQTSRDTGADAAPVRPATEAPARSEAPGPDLSRAAYRWLRRDWGAHLGRAESQGEHRFDLDGAGALIERIAAFTGSEHLAAETRARLGDIVGEYRAHAAARDRVRVFLRDVDRHWLRYDAIARRARNLDIDVWEQRFLARSGWTATRSCCGRAARSSTTPRPTTRISTASMTDASACWTRSPGWSGSRRRTVRSPGPATGDPPGASSSPEECRGECPEFEGHCTALHALLYGAKTHGVAVFDARTRCPASFTR